MLPGILWVRLLAAQTQVAECLPGHLQGKDPGVGMSWADGEEDQHGASGRDEDQHGIAAHGCSSKETSSSQEEYVPRRDHVPFGCLLGKMGLKTLATVLIAEFSLGSAASTVPPVVYLLASCGIEGTPGPSWLQAGMGAGMGQILLALPVPHPNHTRDSPHSLPCSPCPSWYTLKPISHNTAVSSLAVLSLITLICPHCRERELGTAHI